MKEKTEKILKKQSSLCPDCEINEINEDEKKCLRCQANDKIAKDNRGVMVIG